MDRSSLLFTFSGGSTSSSINLEQLDLIGYVAPAMEATTTAFRLQLTLHGPSTVDADAVWYPVYNQSGAVVELPASAAGGAAVAFADPMLALKRVRLLAVDSGGTPVNQTTQSITARVRRMP